MKRWLLQCHRLIHWDQQDEVREVYALIGLCLRNTVFRPWEGLLELKLLVGENANRTTLDNDIRQVTHLHGGRVCRQRISYGSLERFGAPEPSEITLQVELPGARVRFGEVMVTGPALHACLYGP